MTKVFNKKSEKEKRRCLRNNMTRAEIKLWAQLKNRKINNARFLRQYSVGPFILDFYCPEHHIAIEVDGVTHITDEELQYDKIRQDKIEKYGIEFLRFTNSDIYNNMINVLESIRVKIESIKNISPL